MGSPAAPTLDEKIETALDWLRARYEQRGQFISDDDVLDAAHLVSPIDYDLIDAGDLDATLDGVEHEVIVERLFALLSDPS